MARSVQAGADAYQRLLDAIENGQLHPGERLREADLAERLKTSRTPVREALKRLQAQGLVVHEPGRGIIIPVLDQDQLRELYDMREVLEGTAARLAANYASAEEIALLKELVQSDRRRSGDATAFALSNKQFHRQLYRSSHNRYLMQVLDHLRLTLTLLPFTTLSDPDRRCGALDEHEKIVDAVAKRDDAAAEALAREHIRHAYASRLRQIISRETEQESASVSQWDHL